MHFLYDKETIAAIKQIPGYRYFPSTKKWYLPVTNEIIKQALKLPGAVILADSLPLITPLLETPRNGAYIAPQGGIIKPIQPPKPKMETKPIILPDGLKLYPFQEETVAFIESRNGRALVALEMGLGKSPTSLVWLRIHPEIRPAIIVCPASLRINWGREATTWLEKTDNIEIISGRPSDSNQILKSTNIIIVNYDILFDLIDKKTKKITQIGWWSVLKKLNPKAIIIDESHFCKSNSARRTKAVQALVGNNNIETAIPNVIALSGTPIVNRPIEFYNVIQLINPQAFPNYWRFTERYCGRFQKDIWVKVKGKAKKRSVSDFTGATHIEELHTILTETLMFRRLKKDVLQDLPDKIRSVIPLEIDNRREYTEAENDFIEWLRREKGNEAADKAEKAQTLVKIGKLKQLASRGKLSNAISWVRDVIDDREKLILFVTRHETADILMKEFDTCAVKLTGRESMEERQSSVDRFQEDESILLFIGMLDSQGKPAGVGLTLTAATHVAFLEHIFSPLVCDQAEDRAHRIGQKNAVNVYYLVAEKTIEEESILLLDTKRHVLQQVLDGTIPESGSILTELLEKYRNKEK